MTPATIDVCPHCGQVLRASNDNGTENAEVGAILLAIIASLWAGSFGFSFWTMLAVFATASVTGLAVIARRRRCP